MTAKRVWGIVLIVLGVIAIISGIQQIAEIAELDGLVGKWISNSTSDSSSPYAIAIHNARVGGLIKILVGIFMAAGGTWMVKDEEPVKIDNRHFEIEKDYDDWK